MPPRYLHLDLLKHVTRIVSRFRLRAHSVAVESSFWHGLKVCDKCSCAAVQNEVHDLFHCQDLSVCSLRKEKKRKKRKTTLRRKNYSFLFLPYCQSSSVKAPYHLHDLPYQAVFDSLPERHDKLCCVISDIMDYFFGWQRPATDQSA